MGKPKLPSSSIFYLPIAVAQLSAKRKLPTLPLYPLRYLNEIPFNPFFKSFSSPSATSVAFRFLLTQFRINKKGSLILVVIDFQYQKVGFVIIISFCSLCTHIAYRDSNLILSLPSRATNTFPLLAPPV